jgi:hypothetical protein
MIEINCFSGLQIILFLVLYDIKKGIFLLKSILPMKSLFKISKFLSSIGVLPFGKTIINQFRLYSCTFIHFVMYRVRDI